MSDNWDRRSNRNRRHNTRDASTSTIDLVAENERHLPPMSALAYKSLVLFLLSTILHGKVKREEAEARRQRSLALATFQPSTSAPARTTDVVALYVAGARDTGKCFYCNANTTNVCGRCEQVPFCNVYCQENGFGGHEELCTSYLSRATEDAEAAQVRQATQADADAKGRATRAATAARVARAAQAAEVAFYARATQASLSTQIALVASAARATRAVLHPEDAAPARVPLAPLPIQPAQPAQPARARTARASRGFRPRSRTAIAMAE